MPAITLETVPVAKTGMMIRRPAAEVFEAFVDPAVTTKFWFTKSSGRLEAGRSVIWTWEMYGASTEVTVKALEPGKRIVVEWQGYRGPTTVEWKLAALTGETTFVSVTESGFAGSGDEIVAAVINSGQGFTWTLAGAKALLEHGVRLNLVADRFPNGPTVPYPDE